MFALKKILKKSRTLVFLDLEGTQFSHEIIAIGAIKCKINDDLKIIEENNEKLLIYVKPKEAIGKIIKELTNLTDEFIEKNGYSFDNALIKIKDYVGEDFNNCTFVVFGSNDARMFIESEKHSHPLNRDICHTIVSKIFDYLAFISQFIRDEHNNTYSLVNYLSVFGKNPQGISHNPLNDALDLKSLYTCFLERKDIVKEEYKKLLNKHKIYPEPIKKILNKLDNDCVVTKEDFDNFISDYLA